MSLQLISRFPDNYVKSLQLTSSLSHPTYSYFLLPFYSTFSSFLLSSPPFFTVSSIIPLSSRLHLPSLFSPSSLFCYHLVSSLPKSPFSFLISHPCFLFSLMPFSSHLLFLNLHVFFSFLLYFSLTFSPFRLSLFDFFFCDFSPLSFSLLSSVIILTPLSLNHLIILHLILVFFLPYPFLISPPFPSLLSSYLLSSVSALAPQIFIFSFLIFSFIFYFSLTFLC